MSFKQLIAMLLGKANLELRKHPGVPYKAIPVFELAVRYHMKRTGEKVAFVQVGAHDGKQHGDPLHEFIINYEWHGVLVEPQPAVYRKLVSNYAECGHRLKFENSAISSTNGSITLFRARQSDGSENMYGTDVVSFSRKITERQLGVAESELEQFDVQCMTLDDLLEKHGISELDVLQIDTEGHDWSVLSSLDLRNVRPAIIQFEHGHLTRNECREIVAHLNRFGYWIHWGGHQLDSVAVREDFFRS